MNSRPDGNLFNAINNLNADILAIHEVDYLQSRSNNSKQVEEIANNCGFSSWAFAPAITGTPGSSWKTSHELITNKNNQLLQTSYGIGLLSKIPVRNWHRLSLRKSPIGLPLAITSENGTKVAYIPDEPRAAIAAELENGITVITAHLSFVPPVNTLQLIKIRKWAQDIPGKKIYIGDFNALLFGTAGIKSINKAKSYPGWSPKVKFDYILSNSIKGQELKFNFEGVSDHLPIGVEIDS
jgi:endonuclease/exonuclease/phosphatase family metal-dependent hydrolase